MVIDLTRLNSGIDKIVPVDMTFSFGSDSLDGTEVTSIDDVKITGEITRNSIDNIVLTLDVEGTMIIPCAITLKPVDYCFSFVISEELEGDCSDSNTKYQNSLDILPIIWENILMEIPMRVVSEGAEGSSMSGDGWQFIRDDEE